MSEMDWFVAGVLASTVVWVALGKFVFKASTSMQRSVNNTPTPDRQSRATVQRQQTTGDEAVNYRTRNGRSDYRFRIARTSDRGYRVYILNQPSYGSRGTGDHATHRLSDPHGRYVCWTGRLNTREEARQVAATWADKTEDYILKGLRF